MEVKIMGFRFLIRYGFIRCQEKSAPGEIGPQKLGADFSGEIGPNRNFGEIVPIVKFYIYRC